jgi:site-specific DNA-adenine methylase
MLPNLIPLLSLWHGNGKYVEPFVGGGSVSYIMRQLFPEAKHCLSDANKWLMSAYDSQLLPAPDLSMPITQEWIEGMRNANDVDYCSMTTNERALRFATCLYTAWGNRWEAKDDGAFKSTANKKYCDSDFLRAKFESFFGADRWLRDSDMIMSCSWEDILPQLEDGDCVFLDPPYPECLGYGNQVWRLTNALDVIDWMSENRDKYTIIATNVSDLERLFNRAGFTTELVAGPVATRTRLRRFEVVAHNLGG